MKSAFAALALASLFTSPAWAQDPDKDGDRRRRLPLSSSLRRTSRAGAKLSMPPVPVRGCSRPLMISAASSTAITPGSTGGRKRL